MILTLIAHVLKLQLFNCHLFDLFSLLMQDVFIIRRIYLVYYKPCLVFRVLATTHRPIS